MKRKSLRSVFFCFWILPICLPSLVHAQEINDEQFLRQQLTQALKYGDEGDLLFAAQLINYIIDQSTDSLLKAEALYKLTTVGEAAAKRYTARFALPRSMYGVYYQTDQLKSSRDWNDIFIPQIEKEMALWKTLRIDLVHNTWFDDHYVSNNTKIYQELYNQYPETEWGEAALKDMVTQDTQGYGVNSPEGIVERGLAFLSRYPNSKHKKWIYTALGYSYSDQLKLTGCYNNSAEEDALRSGAITYMKLAVEDYTEDSNVANTMKHFIAQLEEGKCPETYFFFSD